MNNETAAPNSRAALQVRQRAGSLGWRGPLVLLAARLVFAWLAYGLVGALFAALGKVNPWESAAGWWPVYGILIDVSCLGLLAYFLRGEGLRLFDLLSWSGRWQRTVLLSVGLILLEFMVGLGGGMLLTTWLYGSSQGNPPLVAPLPGLALLYALTVFPVVWGIAEEMTYQGYALPRLQVLTGRTWLAVIAIVVFFGLQHTALPVRFDARFMLWRAVSAALIGVVVALAYLRVRQLVPFIVAHWFFNLLTVLLLLLPPPA